MNMNPASTKEQTLKFLVQVREQNSSKYRTISKGHFASRLFTYNCYKQKLYIAY